MRVSARPERDVAHGGASDTADCETKATGRQALEQHVAAAVLDTEGVVCKGASQSRQGGVHHGRERCN